MKLSHTIGIAVFTFLSGVLAGLLMGEQEKHPYTDRMHQEAIRGCKDNNGFSYSDNGPRSAIITCKKFVFGEPFRFEIPYVKPGEDEFVGVEGPSKQHEKRSEPQ